MKKYIPLFARISILLAALSLVVYFAAIRSFDFADRVNETVGVAVRFLLARASVFLPFSLFELLIICSPLLLFLIIYFAIRRGADAALRVRFIFSLIGVISLIFTSYIYTLGIAYRTTGISEKTGIREDTDITEEELIYTVNTVLEEVNRLASDFSLSNGETRLSYSIGELSERLVKAYGNMISEYPILTNYESKVKPVHFSTVMSELGILGIYSFFTGEANVNVEYPDYCLVFTAAHEMAHQRGVAKENEANFTAFLVCISSEDEYIRYAGYLNLYEYLVSALYRLNPEENMSVSERLDENARADIRAANAVYKKHKDSILGKINDRLNDAYLKANGQDGVVSYNYVVKLAVGYFCKEEQ